MGTIMRALSSRPVIAAVLWALSSIAFAQSWPSRPVSLVVSQAVSTAPDFVARTLSGRLSERLKVAVVVDNRPGASGNIGAEYVSNAAPDGYTLFLAPSSFITNAAVNRKLRFDPIKSYAPIVPLAEGLQCLVVSSGSPVKSVKDLVALVKSQPGKLFYGTPGNGTTHHLIMEQFKLDAGMDLVHVPYKGLTGAVVDLLGGRVNVMFMTTSAAAPYMQRDQLRMLADQAGAQFAAARHAHAGRAGVSQRPWRELVRHAGARGPAPGHRGPAQHRTECDPERETGEGFFSEAEPRGQWRYARPNGGDPAIGARPVAQDSRHGWHHCRLSRRDARTAAASRIDPPVDRYSVPLLHDTPSTQS